MDNKLNWLHTYSTLNKERLEKAKTCCCFYCLSEFDYSEIKDWVDDNKTALCPKCVVVDAVLPKKIDFKLEARESETSTYTVSFDDLTAMRAYWF